jgi:drug/metabolite transporter (DMT)-like permease
VTPPAAARGAGVFPMLAAAGTGVQVGAALVATRFVVDEAGPVSLALLRYIVGFLCLLPFVLRAGKAARIGRRDLLPIALIGIVQFAGVVAVLNFGLQYIPAGRAALIFATFPLIAMLLAAALGQERLTLAKTAGVTLTILGVGVALGDRALERGGAPDAWIGELAVFFSAFCGALSSVLYRPYLRRYPALPVGALAMLASVGFLALLAAGEGFYAAWPRFSTGGWIAVIFIGVSSGVFFYLWLWALERTTATKVTVFLALSPITAAALGALLLGEALTLLLLAGLVCVVLGLGVALWPAKAPQANGSRAPRAEAVLSKKRRSEDRG